MTLLEFERKMFTDTKQASGWKDTGGGADAYEWVEGGNAVLTADESKSSTPPSRDTSNKSSTSLTSPAFLRQE